MRMYLLRITRYATDLREDQTLDLETGHFTDAAFQAVVSKIAKKLIASPQVGEIVTIRIEPIEVVTPKR